MAARALLNTNSSPREGPIREALAGNLYRYNAYGRIIESVSTYLKARERESGDFALASAACPLEIIESTIAQASVVLGGLAPVPHRAREVEEYLRGKWSSEINPAHAGSLALPNATPMTDNGYKLVLARNLVKRAVGRMLGG